MSFVVPKDKWGGKKEVSLLSAKRDEKVWKRIVEVQGVIRGKEGMAVDEWKFEKKQVEGFRYRMEDALRSVTKVAVREARVKEIKNEVVNSEKLKVRVPSSILIVIMKRFTEPYIIPPSGTFRR